MATLERTVILTALLILPSSLASHSPTAITTACSESSVNRELSRDVFDFGLGLQRAILMIRDHGNIVLSPTSVYGALALTLLGSVGQTYDELVQALRFSNELSVNRARHRDLGLQLSRLSCAEGSRTLYADGLFLERSARLRLPYKHFLHNVYNATVTSVDFGDPDRALDIINQWIAEHTENKISRLLTEPLPESTRMVVATALYFRGQWQTPFLPQYTKKMNFSRDVHDPSQDVLVDSMLNIHKFNYTLSLHNDCELLALPYNDTKTVMYILKPLKPERKSLDLLLQELDAKAIDNMINESRLRNVIVRFPKMNISTTSELRPHLESLGIHSAFSQEQANFALMVNSSRSGDELSALKLWDNLTDSQIKRMLSELPNPGLYVDRVLHKAAISIDEYGTEAVAATAGFVARTAVDFYLHSPFFFFIRNENTKLVTFSAAIYDPTN